MTPTTFAQSNGEFGPPEGIAESQVQTVPTFTGQLRTGSMDGERVIVVAWKPDAREMARLNAGEPVFLTCLGLLPPHCLTTSFEEATGLA